MDMRTGEIKPWDQIPQAEQKHFVQVRRDLSRQEKLAKQIGLYSPCACGSGNKFKFCCFEKETK